MVVVFLLLVMIADTCITAYMVAKVKALTLDVTSCCDVVADITKKQLGNGEDV